MNFTVTFEGYVSRIEVYRKRLPFRYIEARVLVWFQINVHRIRIDGLKFDGTKVNTVLVPGL